MSSLYSRVVRDDLVELAYPALAAGYSFDFSSDVDGFDVRLSGYSSGVASFASKCKSLASRVFLIAMLMQ